MDRNLFFFDDIKKDTIKPIIEKIYEINDHDNEKEEKEVGYKRKPVTLVLNSNGGLAYDGFSLADVIERSKTPVHIHATGLIASAGLVLLLSAHKKYGDKNSTFVYHSVSSGARGCIEWLKNELKESERIQAMYNAYITKRSRLDTEKMKYYYEHQKDWFIAAQEALQMGLIDEIL